MVQAKRGSEREWLKSPSAACNVHSRVSVAATYGFTLQDDE